MVTEPAPADILTFWYTERMRSQWFSSTTELDKEIGEKFEPTWNDAATNKLDSWRNTPEGCLALAIVLDQFPLNMFRGSAKSYSTEAKAVEVSKQAIKKGFDKLIDPDKLAFLYMPLMHSETLSDQDLCVELMSTARLEANASFAKHHREIIRRFGRFPHRNAALNRKSTEAELAYLESGEAFRG